MITLSDFPIWSRFILKSLILIDFITFQLSVRQRLAAFIFME